ncbi:FtsK/SpoIIIE domain-containing protein [Nonomuraea sediminis]|uniref:FtsK/SpoIIIE domain-containing protein n=1 Tax=Nonomuraea sediminis TaxID=2835864 RepID=UPI0027E20825|nr:FtsK/SpoIIIE domain-containing protein [Nonomuraea sediminis]
MRHWQDAAESLAHAFGALSCRVAVRRGGRLLLTLPRRDPLANAFGAVRLPAAATLRPVIGWQEDGEPWRLRVAGTHVLVAGATGAGKGSVLWSTVRGLLPGVAEGTVKLWGLDPKLMELSLGRSLFGDRYAASPEECADLLERAVAEMQERARYYAGRVRKHRPTVEEPFCLVIVDEVAFLTAYQPNKQIRARIMAALATLTTQGRAVGFCVLAALQDPRKDVLTIRNLFPDRIALRLDEPEQVDMVLGDGARDRGALADEISHVEEEGAGVGYVRVERSPDPVRVRAAFISDEVIRAMAAAFGEHA